MGAWGPGNLENDGAQDELTNVCEKLFHEVVDLLQHPNAHEYDDEVIDQLFVRIEVIFALQDRGMLSLASPIEDLEQHLDPYLEKWNCYCRDEGDGEWPERRKVIESTFEKLRAIASETREGTHSHRLDLITEKLGQRDAGHDASSENALSEEERERMERKIRSILGDL